MTEAKIETHPGNRGPIRVAGIAVLLALALHFYLNGARAGLDEIGPA